MGKPGTPGSALYPVAEKNNTRGVCEMGVLPRLPGPAPGYRGRSEKNSVAEPGPTWRSCWTSWRRAKQGRPRPFTSWAATCCAAYPTGVGSKKLLKKVPFIVVQDAFLTDTAQLAQVVLPVAVHAEQEGTFISSTGQLGLLNQALPNNGVRPDWQIISQLGVKMGFALKYGNPKDIFRELAQKMPLWAGLAPKLSAPCPDFKLVLNGEFVPFETDVSLPGPAALRPGGGQIPATLRLLHHPPSLRHPVGHPWRPAED